MNNTNWKRTFYILWAGQAVSVLTSSVLQMALIWNLTAITQSAFILSMASLAGFLPSAVLGTVAGTLIDRMDRKTVLIVADLFIALVSLIIAAVSFYSSLPTWLVIAVLAVRSIGTAFHTPAINAVVPLIVPTEKLTKCAGYTQSLQTIGYIAGTAIAGVLYPIWSISGMVALDVAGAVIASLAVSLIRIPKPEKDAETRSDTSFWIEIKEGYSIVKQDKGVFALIWIAAAFMLLYSPINALFPLMSLDYFEGTTLQASVAEIAFSAGMIIGGIILGMCGGFKNRGIGISISIALMGVPIFISGLLPQNGFWGFAFLCVIMGIACPFYNGPVTALMQERIAADYLGRAFGLYSSAASLAMPVGLIISGFFADGIGVNKWFLITGILIVFISVLCLVIPSIKNIDSNGTENK